MTSIETRDERNRNFIAYGQKYRWGEQKKKNLTFLQAFLNLMRSSGKKKELAERLPAGGIQNVQRYKERL